MTDTPPAPTPTAQASRRPMLGTAQTLAVAKREVTSLFYSPVAYMVLFVFTLVTSLLFARGFGPSYPASMEGEFRGIVWLLVFIAPAISMRLFSEELSSGTIEMLMTAPLSDTQLVLGKWLGAMGFFLSLLLPLVVQIFVLELKADPDYGPIVSGLLGILLVGGLYVAIGTFISAFSDSQLVAFMITVLITGSLTIGAYLLSAPDWAPWVKQVLFYLNVDAQYEDFAKGLMQIRNLVYFATSIPLFLFLAVKVVESRRWR